jgi:glycosyltransferase involved in cell wall biosynthesis
MRIGIYDPYLDSLGGGEKYMLTAAQCLSDEHDVNIFWNDKTILRKAHEKLNIDTTRISLATNIFAPNVSTITRLISSMKYDIIFFLSDGSIPLTLARKTILHFQFPVEWVNANTFTNKLKLNKVFDIICNSNFTKKYIDRKFNINSTVLYPPCGDTNTSVDIPAKHNTILTVGRYNALPEGGSFKKHELMLAAFKHLIDAGLKDWKFVIATSYLDENKKYIDKLEKQIEGYPVEIIRNASFSHITSLYQQAKIYWHASGYRENMEKHPERTEHFGIVTVEAMHYGVVPVVINAGGQPEIIEQGDDGFLWNTTEELIQYTQKLIKHDTIREKMSKAAIEKAKMFSTDNFCKQLKDYIL